MDQKSRTIYARDSYFESVAIFRTYRFLYGLQAYLKKVSAIKGMYSKAAKLLKRLYEFDEKDAHTALMNQAQCRRAFVSNELWDGRAVCVMHNFMKTQI